MKFIRFEFNNEFHKNVFRLCLIVKIEYRHSIELLVHVIKQLFLYVLYVLDWLQIILKERSWSTGVSGYNGVNSCFTVKSLFYDRFSPLSVLKINIWWMYLFHLNDFKVSILSFWLFVKKNSKCFFSLYLIISFIKIIVFTLSRGPLYFQKDIFISIYSEGHLLNYLCFHSLKTTFLSTFSLNYILVRFPFLDDLVEFILLIMSRDNQHR